MELSIIIPMYNDFEGLKKSVEEIKRQKYKCEVIVKMDPTVLKVEII